MVVVLLLVPALAWLQYRWVGQVSEAERERMQRTLRTAATQFATDFDTELSRAVVGLQVEGAIARDENWTAYAQRYSAWTERAADPRLLREVLLVDTVRGADNKEHAVKPEALRLRRWNNDQRSFEPERMEHGADAISQHAGRAPRRDPDDAPGKRAIPPRDRDVVLGR